MNRLWFGLTLGMCACGCLVTVRGQEKNAAEQRVDAQQLVLERLAIEVTEDNDGLLVIKRIASGGDERLKVGDQILAVNGDTTVTLQSLSELLASKSGEVNLKLMRGDQAGEMRVPLLRAMDKEVEAEKPKTLNFGGMTLKSLELPAVVTKVDPKTPAWDSGVRAGDRLLAVDNVEPETFDSLSEIISATAKDRERLEVPLRVQRGDEKLDLEMQLRTASQVATERRGVIERRMEREADAAERQRAVENNAAPVVDAGPDVAPVAGLRNGYDDGSLLYGIGADGTSGMSGIGAAMVRLEPIGQNRSPRGVVRMVQNAGGIAVELAMPGASPRTQTPDLQPQGIGATPSTQQTGQAQATQWAIGIATHGDLRLFQAGNMQQPTGNANPRIPGNTQDPRGLRVRPGTPGVGDGVYDEDIYNDPRVSGAGGLSVAPGTPGAGTPSNDPRVSGAGGLSVAPGTPGAGTPSSDPRAAGASGLTVRPGTAPGTDGTVPGPLGVPQPQQRVMQSPQSGNAIDGQADSANQSLNAANIAGGPYMVVVRLQQGPNGTLQGFISNANIQSTLGRALAVIRTEAPVADPRIVAGAAGGQDAVDVQDDVNGEQANAMPNENISPRGMPQAIGIVAVPANINSANNNSVPSDSATNGRPQSGVGQPNPPRR